MNYAQALKAGSRDGWARAEGLSMTAAYAQSLASKWCMQPKAIYDWAVKHRVDIQRHAKALHEDDLWIWEQMLNDLPFKETP